MTVKEWYAFDKKIIITSFQIIVMKRGSYKVTENIMEINVLDKDTTFELFGEYELRFIKMTSFGDNAPLRPTLYVWPPEKLTETETM